MNGAEFMAAMGDIADSYIMEFADVTPGKRRGVWQPLLYMAACLILAIGIAAVFPTIANRRTDPKDPTDRPKDNVSSGVAGDSDAPLHFYLDGKAFIMAPEITIVTEVPKGYRYVGTVTDVGDTFSGRDFEGNMSGDVYLSKDGRSAYVQSSKLKMIDGERPFVLCTPRTPNATPAERNGAYQYLLCGAACLILMVGGAVIFFRARRRQLRKNGSPGR